MARSSRAMTVREGCKNKMAGLQGPAKNFVRGVKPYATVRFAAEVLPFSVTSS